MLLPKSATWWINDAKLMAAEWSWPVAVLLDLIFATEIASLQRLQYFFRDKLKHFIQVLQQLDHRWFELNCDIALCHHYLRFDFDK